MLNPEWIHFLRHEESVIVQGLIIQHAKKNKETIKILEIGSGDGYMASKLISSGFNVTSIEPVPRQPVYVPLIQSFSDRLPFPNNQFDLVFSSNVLEHVEELPTSFREMRRVLAEDGIMIHSMPSVACSLLTTTTAPLIYPRNLYLLFTGYFFKKADLKRPFQIHRLKIFNHSQTTIKLTRIILITLTRLNPLSIFRTVGHGTARSPIHELTEWRVQHWIDIFKENGIVIIDITKHPIAASMNKLIGKHFLKARSLLAKKGLHVDNIYITTFSRKRG